MTLNNTIVAIYGAHAEAEAALTALRGAGFDMRKLSIVACDLSTHQHGAGFCHPGDRMRYWGATGACWGGIWGMLIGSAFFFVPGVGPLLVAGPLVCAILGALDGALLTGGMNAFGGGLYSLGVPENMVLQYQGTVTSGKCMVIAQGTAQELRQAREVVAETHPEALDQHTRSDVQNGPGGDVKEDPVPSGHAISSGTLTA